MTGDDRLGRDLPGLVDAMAAEVVDISADIGAAVVPARWAQYYRMRDELHRRYAMLEPFHGTEARRIRAILSTGTDPGVIAPVPDPPIVPYQPTITEE